MQQQEILQKFKMLTCILGLICLGRKNEVDGESCNGANVLNGTRQVIIDTNKQVWTINSDAKVVKNDTVQNETQYVIRLVYLNNSIYHQNCYKNYWKWENKSWQSINDSSLPNILSNTHGCIDSVCSVLNETEPNTSVVNFTEFLEKCSTIEIFLEDGCEKDIQKLTSLSTESVSTSTEIRTTSISTTDCDNANCQPKQPCNLEINPCENGQPCYANNLTMYGYDCDCGSNFTGRNCETYIGLCQPDSCYHHGICREIGDTFECICPSGRTGDRCQDVINYCAGVQCQNKGICRSIALTYKCECLYGTSGEFCENVSSALVTRRIVSKSFGYIGIIVLSLTVGFFVVLDVMKYVFGIDVVDRDRRERIENLRRSTQQQRRRKALT